MQKSGRRYPEIDVLECKGCGRCVAACPKSLLSMSAEFNSRGYRYAVYCGQGCTACGLCFYACPEPYAIRVERGETADKSDQGG